MSTPVSDHVYKQFRAEEMESHFNPRAVLPNVDGLIAERSAKSAETRKKLQNHRNLAYGDSERQVVDIFPAAKPNAPVNLYIHGGYWRAVSKDDVSQIANHFHAKGVTAVLLEYDLCPNVTLTDIVRQARQGVAWTYRNIANYGGDPDRFYISGSSAGGHLVGMVLAHDWSGEEGIPEDFIKGAVVITGVMDTDPVLHVTPNEQIQLTPELAHTNNPMLNPPTIKSPLIIAVGGDEPTGWRQMSKDYYDLCKSRGLTCEYHEVPGTHHFSVTESMGKAGSLMQNLVFGQMGISV